MHYKLQIVILILIFLSGPMYSRQSAYTSVQATDSIKVKIDTIVQEDSAIEIPDQPEPKQYRNQGESMNGIIIPDCADSTILLLLYGSYTIDTDGLYYFNAGPWPFEERFSIIMRPDHQYEDDSTMVVYARGQETATAANHDMYREDALILHRVDSGWIVADSYDDGFSPDFQSLHYLGTYGHGHYLMRREYGGVYGGGHLYEEVDYFMISRNSLKGPSISLEVINSDAATGRCDSNFFGEHNTNCGCHGDKGTSTYAYDSTLDCIVIRFENYATKYECMETNPITTHTTQVWYMTEDTALLAIDIDSTAKGYEGNGTEKLIWKPGDKKVVHLSHVQIKKALANNGRRKKYGFTFSSYPISSSFDR